MSAADNNSSGGGAIGWFANAVDWVAGGISELHDGDLPINRKKRRILNRAGYKRVALSPSRVGWRSPTGEVISGRKALRREVDRLKRAAASPDTITDPIDDPYLFAMAAAGMSAEQEKIWKQRRMAADPKYREKELARMLKEAEKKRYKATVRGRVDPQLKAARDLLKKYGKVIVRDPKLAAKIARVARFGGPTALLTAAYQVGEYIGSQIYEKGTAWYYGGANVPKPAAGRPRTGRLSNVRITAKRLPVPGEPGVTVSRTAPGQRARGPTGPGLPASKQQQAKATAPGASELEPVTITAARLPSVRPVSRLESWSIWANQAAKQAQAIWNTVQQYKPLYDSMSKLRQTPKNRTQTVPQTRPQVQPQPQPLTAVQALGLQSRPCKPCKCTKRKKSNKPRCTNPVISKRKRDRNGVTVQTITRELRC